MVCPFHVFLDKLTYLHIRVTADHAGNFAGIKFGIQSFRFPDGSVLTRPELFSLLPDN
jgi:hypothetical protein